jgi:hypothetical protein
LINIRTSRLGLAAAGATLFVAQLAAQSAVAQDVPGTVPSDSRGRSVAAPMGTASGLKVFFRKFGKYELSVDAAGSNDAVHSVKVCKPSADAVVVKAYLLAALHASEQSGKTIDNGDVTLNGRPVTWFDSVTNDIPPSYPNYFHSVVGDVTRIVSRRMDGAPAGCKNFRLAEVNDNEYIDGEILAVVWQVPSATVDRTIALLFGGQQLAGDRFEVTLTGPIDKGAPGAKAEMGLGISYSLQGGGVQQYSILTVNGQPLSKASGGEDDGATFNGALITAGGYRDSRRNPPDPNAPPTQPRSDDERYNLLPFIGKKDTTIRIDTANPSNDDNIFFAWLDLSAKGQVNQDTDGDGLLDSWEKDGYDHDGDGKIDVPIHQRGADFRKKDIFIAYAWMEASPSEAKSHKPSRGVLRAVADAFANAPVSNPDGTTGVNVHFRNLGGVPHDDDLNPVWDEFDGIMNPLVSEAERKIYHRLLNAHMYSGGTSSGLSRGIPASDFIETLGGWSSNPGTFKQRAGTIMHELGHNLGLRHGGVDHENYKPNHLSVMSYFNQMDWLIKDRKALLDYERFNLEDLDESQLNEAAGLERAGSEGPLKSYGVRWFSGGVLNEKRTKAHSKVDWNDNGNATDSPVAVDLNGSGGNSVLRAGYPEWDNVIYDGGSIGASGISQKLQTKTDPAELVELTFEQYQRLRSNIRVRE